LTFRNKYRHVTTLRRSTGTLRRYRRSTGKLRRYRRSTPNGS
jgi:hypothetical protein